VASVRRRVTRGGERRYEVRWRDALGRSRSRTFVQQRDALRFKTETERRQQLGQLYQAEPLTFIEFLNAWLERYEQRVRDSTYERARQTLKHSLPLSPYRLHEVRAGEVEDLVTKVARSAPRQAGILLQLLKQVMRGAGSRGHAVDPAIFDLVAPRYEEREPRFLTWVEVEELASFCGESRLVAFAALTGLRQGELFALRDVDLNFVRGSVRVVHGSHRGSATRTKSGRTRNVWLTQQAAEIAGQQLDERAANGLGLVFPSPGGAMWQKNNFMARVFRPAVRRAELGDVIFHDLRHTYASLMIAAGVGPMEVAEQLGHRDARLVLTRYGHLYPGATNRAALALGAYVQAATVGPAWGESGSPFDDEDESAANERWSVPGSNRRPPACKAGALPTELTPRVDSV
jgi:integrase